MKNLKLFILILLLTVATNSYAEIINRVYAVVGEKIITQYELEMLNPKRLQHIYQKYSGEEREEQLTKYYVGALEMMISNYVIEQAAAKEGVRVSSREVDAAINDIMEKNGVDEARMRELLAASNQTFEQYRWSIKVDILKARLISTVFRPKTIITDEDIKQYVADHAAELELSDTYELRIMSVDSEEDLKEAMADFKETGSFRDTAMKFSKAGNASSGGYLGWIEYAFLDDDIKDVVAGVKQGITKPIKDADGYRIFYVEGYKNKDNISDDKRDNIVKALTADRSKEIFKDWLAENRKEILIQKKYAY